MRLERVQTCRERREQWTSSCVFVFFFYLIFYVYDVTNFIIIFRSLTCVCVACSRLERRWIFERKKNAFHEKIRCSRDRKFTFNDTRRYLRCFR